MDEKAATIIAEAQLTDTVINVLLKTEPEILSKDTNPQQIINKAHEIIDYVLSVRKQVRIRMAQDRG